MTKKEWIKKKERFNFNKAIFLLFLIAVFVTLKTFFTGLDPSTVLEVTESDLMQEAEIVLDKLTNGNTLVGLLDSNVLSEEKIISLDQMDYDEIKSLLGIKNDFCIFFEDITGNVIKIADIDSGICSGKIYVNGNPCK